MGTATAEREVTVLRQLIDERGLRYSWLAARLGISRGLLSRLLSNERPLSARIMAAFEDILGVPYPVFFDGERLIVATGPAGSSSDDAVSTDPARIAG